MCAWANEASIEQYRREIGLLRIIRLAVNGTPETFNGRIHELEMKVREIEGAAEESYGSAWDYLHAKGEG